MQPSLGWDLAGYGDSGSGLCRADRKGNTITATVLRAPCVCRPRHKIHSSILETVEVEAEMLRRFAKVGNTYIDVPIQLQSLLQVVDHEKDERVGYYWRLVKRPVDHVFDALEPLACNLGFAVARASHILGRLAKEGAALKLGENLFETYPAATLQMVWATNKWTEASYKGGKVEYVEGRWRGQASKKKSPKARQSEEGKATGLSTLANYLCLRASEGCRLNDDEFDAVLCAATGCLPDCTISRPSLTEYIRNKLRAAHGSEDWIERVQPPDGYVVFDRLPEELAINVQWLDCDTPDALFDALGSENIARGQPCSGRK